jgi:hypothetical protein
MAKLKMAALSRSSIVRMMARPELSDAEADPMVRSGIAVTRINSLKINRLQHSCDFGFWRA